MKVLMLGWEFPPYFTGGVGMVCYELTKSLAKIDDIEITYVMPFGPAELEDDAHVKILVANNLISDSKVKIRRIHSLIGAYEDQDSYSEKLSKLSVLRKKGKGSSEVMYGKNLLEEVERFKEKIKLVALSEDFDVIHAHDWTTFPAATALKEMTGKPFIAHVHITEFDKSGGLGADSRIYAIERAGMHAADVVIAISQFVKDNLISRYGVPADKIRVIHNGGVEMKPPNEKRFIDEDDKIVLFAGRMTLQKGPEFFVEAARKVLEVEKNVKFVMAGTGDQFNMIIDKAASMGIANKFMFTGFYTRAQADRLFEMAHVFVMPSVSEPFGLVPLEAMGKGTPTIISKQSGCSEVLRNALAVDFWDINKMANNIVACLRYNTLSRTLSKNSITEMKNFTWDTPASKIVDLYRSLPKNT